ncbi:GAF domain-containing protein [Dactylosporangium sp. NPDC050688]|uniref:GAF domain-containing protein n=1 Tax=Dactylosporangium sp. NPDC050688 TaxID=3157217 RepID=UPI0033DFF0BC
MRDSGIHDQHDASAGPGADTVDDVTFSQVARLELDELLEQLMRRARDVQDAQGRLRGLLHAFLAVARADNLDTVLRHVVEAARDLVDARYAALGAIDGGRLTRFVHTGMDPDVVAQVGHLPKGKGLLGLLVDYPLSLRLADIAEHPASVGFPEHHPPMRSFLGVPIQVGDRIFGNLYLTEKRGGAAFTGDDEQLVRALAAAAGAAIENATLLAESRRRHTWQTAMVEVSTALLAGTDTDEVLRQLVHRARQTLCAAGADVCVPTEDPDQLRLVVTEGDGYHPWQGSVVPVAHSVSGAAITAGQLIVVTDPGADPRTTGTADRAAGQIGETVAVPLIGADGKVNGVLSVSRDPGAEPFDQLDLDLVTAVAAHAGLALHLNRLRADTEQLHLLDDREQLGDELRHHVIHRLFRHGLELQSAASRTTDQRTSIAVRAQIDEVDAIIHDIRTAVFAFDRARPAGGGTAVADPNADAEP